MSRKLKRVPMTFDWPLNQVWGGYLNPYYKLAGKCPNCDHGHDRAGGRPDANAALFHDQWYGNAPFDPIAYGAEPLALDHPAIRALAERNIGAAPDYYMTDAEKKARDDFRHGALFGFPHDKPLVALPGFDREGSICREIRRLHELWRYQWGHHLIQADVDALVESDRLWDFTRVPRDAGQAFVVAIRMAFHDTNSWLPESNGYHPIAAEVNDWSLRGFGHDAINSYTCVRARCQREGVPYECARCGGSGDVWPTSKIKQQCEDWEPTEPPTGDGYQLWENCSEGSPVGPVFTSLEELCAWAADHATTFGSFKATAKEWREMLDDDFVHAEAGGNIFL